MAFIKIAQTRISSILRNHFNSHNLYAAGGVVGVSVASYFVWKFIDIPSSRAAQMEASLLKEIQINRREQKVSTKDLAVKLEQSEVARRAHEVATKDLAVKLEQSEVARRAHEVATKEALLELKTEIRNKRGIYW